MNYVVAGYSIVLGLLFLYAVQLVWRRRRLNRLVALASVDEAGPVELARSADPVQPVDGPVEPPAGERAQDGP